jgi:hypothetical protein
MKQKTGLVVDAGLLWNYVHTDHKVMDLASFRRLH